MTVARKEKHIFQLLQNEAPQSLSCYSLSKEYRAVAFDYDVMVVREAWCISLIMNKNDLKNIDADVVIEEFMQYIEFEDGEIYQMDRSEMSLIYAAKDNTIEWYKTFKVLRKF